jgi:hypothetical protein
MYITEDQLNSLLNSSYFQDPVTKSIVKYALYQGRLNTTVHTLRFNLIEGFNEDFMIQTVLNHLMFHFPLNTRMLASISYDLVLVDPKADPKTYYLWRANSNSVHFNAVEEIQFTLTYDNVYRFVSNSSNVHIPSLNINYESSSVVIDRVIAIVFSFVKL